MNRINLNGTSFSVLNIYILNFEVALQNVVMRGMCVRATKQKDKVLVDGFLTCR